MKLTSCTSVVVDELALLSTQSLFPSDMPRVGLDGFVVDGLSLGGSVAYVRMSDEDDDSWDTLLVAPRIGYAVFFSASIGIWPRGGITYWKRTFTDHDGGEDSQSILALLVEAPLLFSLADAAWLNLGPYLDLGLSGEVASNPDIGPSSSTDRKVTGIGVTAGLTIPL